MTEKEATNFEEEEAFYDCEISWEEFYNPEFNPKISVGFATTVSASMAVELVIKNPNGVTSETLFVFHPTVRESVLRTIKKLNEEDPNGEEVLEVSGEFFTDFLVRWSTSQSSSPQQ
jgi:hypothetical protein